MTYNDNDVPFRSIPKALAAAEAVYIPAYEKAAAEAGRRSTADRSSFLAEQRFCFGDFRVSTVSS